MEKMIRAFIALALCVNLAGCAAGTVPDTSAGVSRNDRELGGSLVQQVFDAYRGYSRDSFNGQVSSDFTPLRSEFVNAVERGFYAGNLMDLNFFLDSVSRTGNKLSVSFKWEKRMTLYTSGQFVKTEGSAVYVFSEENGAWRLYQVRGDDPLARA